MFHQEPSPWWEFRTDSYFLIFLFLKEGNFFFFTVFFEHHWKQKKQSLY